MWLWTTPQFGTLPRKQRMTNRFVYMSHQWHIKAQEITGRLIIPLSLVERKEPLSDYHVINDRGRRVQGFPVRKALLIKPPSHRTRPIPACLLCRWTHLAPRHTSSWNFPSLPMFLGVPLMALMKWQKFRALIRQFSSATSCCSRLSKWPWAFSVEWHTVNQVASMFLGHWWAVRVSLTERHLWLQVRSGALTKVVPDKYAFEETWGLKAMLEDLLKSPD